MKKAFMRGVCALNMEAMGMFREGEEGGQQAQPAQDGRVAHSGMESALDLPGHVQKSTD